MANDAELTDGYILEEVADPDGLTWEQARAFHRQFTESLPDRIPAFIAEHLPHYDGPHFTPPALHAAEEAFRGAVTEVAELFLPECATAFFGLHAYYGETIMRMYGGDWLWQGSWWRGEFGRGLPYIRFDGPVGPLHGGYSDPFPLIFHTIGNSEENWCSVHLASIPDVVSDPAPFRSTSALIATDPEQPTCEWHRYLAEHDEILRAWIAQRDPAKGRLDFSEDSLDRLESDLLLHYPDRAALEAVADGPFYAGLCRYVTETFVRCGGGRINISDPAVRQWVPIPADDFPFLERTDVVDYGGEDPPFLLDMYNVVNAAVDVDRGRTGGVWRTELAEHRRRMA